MGTRSSEPDIQSIPLAWLVAIALATFLVSFVILEIVDPRWIAALRSRPNSAVPLATPPSTLGQVLPPPPLATPPPSPAQSRASPTQRTSPAATPSGSRDDRRDSAPRARQTGEAAPRNAIVSGTGEGGARLRSGPNLEADVLTVIDEGTTVLQTGRVAESIGRTWIQVRTLDGTVGWLAGELVTVPEPTSAP